MNDTLNKLKEIWQQNEPSVDSLEDVNRRFSTCLSRTRVQSLQENLYKRTLRTGYIGFILPLLSPLLFFVLHLPVWFAIVYGIFGVVAGTMSSVLAEYIKRFDLMALPIEDALLRAASIRRKMLIQQISDSTLGVVLLATMLFQINILPDRLPLMVGFFIGLALGMAYSIPKMIKNFRIIRQMMDSLKE